MKKPAQVVHVVAKYCRPGKKKKRGIKGLGPLTKVGWRCYFSDLLLAQTH